MAAGRAWRVRRENRSVCVYPAARASATASAKPAASSAGSCASELISSGTPACVRHLHELGARDTAPRHSFRRPAVLISNAVPVSASAAIAGS